LLPFEVSQADPAARYRASEKRKSGPLLLCARCGLRAYCAKNSVPVATRHQNFVWLKTGGLSSADAVWNWPSSIVGVEPDSAVLGVHDSYDLVGPENIHGQVGSGQQWADVRGHMGDRVAEVVAPGDV
jgi:hypothetical protein